MVTPPGAEPKHPGGGIFWDPAEHDGAGHPRRWAILGVLLVSLLIVVLDNTVLNIALPTIQRDLKATPGELVWAVDAYILSFAAFLFTWGVLGDKYGRRRILLIAARRIGGILRTHQYIQTAGLRDERFPHRRV